MAKLSKYPTAATFKTTQKFLATNPSTSEALLVRGSDIVNGFALSQVYADLITDLNQRVEYIRTTNLAVQADLAVGRVIITTGVSVENDGLGGHYVVVIAGTTDSIPMDNGNALLLLEAIAQTVQYIDSVASLSGFVGSVDGQQISVGEYNASSNVGNFGAKWRADLARTVHNGFQYHSPSRNLTTEGLTAYLVDSADAVLGVWENTDSVLTPQMGGAFANDVADDTAALQNSIDLTPVGQILDLQGLSYQSLGLVISSKIILINGKISNIDATTTSVITITAAASGTKLKNIKTFIDTSLTTATDASGIFINGADDIELTECEADGAIADGGLHGGIYAQGGNNFKAVDCVSRNSLKEGVITRNTNNVTFVRCSGYDNGLSGVGTSEGLNLLAVDCYGENSGASGVTFNSQNMRIIRPKTKNNTSQNGITLGHDLDNQDCGDVYIEDPEVIGAPAIGLFAVFAYNFTMIGGKFINGGDTAVKITTKAFVEGSISISGGLIIDGIANGASAWSGTNDKLRTNIVVPTVLNGWAYQCIESGTTSGSEPAWPTTQDATVIDGTVTWQAYQLIEPATTVWLASTAYALGDRIFSSDFNGYAFDCTSAGTTGATEPLWDKTLSAVNNDNSVAWTTTKLLGANGIEVTSGGSANFFDINISGYDIKNIAGTAIGITCDRSAKVTNGYLANVGRGMRVNGSFADKAGNTVATFFDGDVNTTTNRITVTSHPFTNAEAVNVTSYGKVPGGISGNTAEFYYIKSIDSNTVELYSDVGLTTIVNLTSATGGGQHYIGTADVRIGTLRELTVNDVSFRDIKRSSIYVGNIAKANISASFSDVSTDGAGDPVIDQFGSSGGQAIINLPMASPLTVNNTNTRNIDATSSFVNAPKNYFDTTTKEFHYNFNNHESLAINQWFTYDDVGTSKYQVFYQGVRYSATATELGDITAIINTSDIKDFDFPVYDSTVKARLNADGNLDNNVWRTADGPTAYTPT